MDASNRNIVTVVNVINVTPIPKWPITRDPVYVIVAIE
jgi:hypothetical protein